MATTQARVQALQGISMGRLGFGVAGLLAPGLFLRQMGGKGADTPAAALVTRLWASREIVLGLVTLQALEDGKPPKRIVQLNALVDGTDAVAALVAGRGIPLARRLGVLLGAVGATAASVALARELASPASPPSS
jgi:hypothetical protein